MCRVEVKCDVKSCYFQANEKCHRDLLRIALSENEKGAYCRSFEYRERDDSQC